MTGTDRPSSPEGEGHVLYHRLLTGDATAPADLALTYLDRLTDWLLTRNPRADSHDCATAAEDALLALIKNPASYRPERQSLEVYLRMSASGDLKNLWRAERRHSSRRASWESVEFSPAVGKYLQEADDPAWLIERDEVEAPPIPARVQERLTPGESRVLELLRQGERRTEVYVAALGLSARPLTEQRRAVKRVKDRLKKRLERAGGSYE